MRTVGISDENEYLKQRYVQLEALITRVSDAWVAFMRAANAINPLYSFKDALESGGAPKRRKSYLEAVCALANFLDIRGVVPTRISARQATSVYEEGQKRLKELSSQIEAIQRAKNTTNAPPQVGSENSVRTVSGGLPTLGRRRR